MARCLGALGAGVRVLQVRKVLKVSECLGSVPVPRCVGRGALRHLQHLEHPRHQHPGTKGTLGTQALTCLPAPSPSTRAAASNGMSSS